MGVLLGQKGVALLKKWLKQDSTVQTNDRNCLLINVRYLWLLFSKYIYEGEVERVTKKATSSNEGGMVHETVERSESNTIYTFIGKTWCGVWWWMIVEYFYVQGMQGLDNNILFFCLPVES